jgi:hypothetical protein
MLVKYLRWPNGVPYACIVGHRRMDGKLGIGWSLCHPKDKFNKARAREIAMNRAIKGYNSKPASRPTYGDNTDVLINNEMQAMLSRTERYYNTSMV